jgi:hypothetical protein
LFDRDVGFTETFVFDGPDGAKADVRVAYGRCQKGFWFYLSMTRSEEAEFKKTFDSWRKDNPGGIHQYTAAPLGVRPPTCGTPNTPPCVLQVRPVGKPGPTAAAPTQPEHIGASELAKG